MDEVANPTATDDLAAAILSLIETGAYGNYHLVNEGACSRYAFARFFLDECGLEETEIAPITRADWPRASTPPSFSALANQAGAALGIRLRALAGSSGRIPERGRSASLMVGEKGAAEAGLLSVIIPNWNGMRYLPTCLAALAAQDYAPLEIIVVDNASDDGSVEYLRAEHLDVRLLELPQNRGSRAHATKGCGWRAANIWRC